jgi:hypothetical protein
VDGVTARPDQPRHRPASAVAEPPRRMIRPGLSPSGVRPVLPGVRCQVRGQDPARPVTITIYDWNGDGIVVTVHEEGHEQVAGEGVNAA